MLNNNYGHNKDLVDACGPLQEYSWLIDKIRRYKKEYDTGTAVTRAVIDMPECFEIREFLRKNMAEVVDMMLAEDQENNALELVGAAREKREELRELKLE